MYKKIYYNFTKLFTFKFRTVLKKNFLSYVANNSLDKKLQRYIDYYNGYFVELGANDGINQSNTFFFEKKRNWKGVLIEPYKNNYLECIKNRSKKNKFYCAACVSNKFKNKTIKLIYANLFTADINSNKNFDQIVKNSKNLKQVNNPFYFRSKARTLNNILKSAKSPKKIDLLCLDVEGSELEVLKGINFMDFSFKYILIESNEFKKIRFFLKKKNYFLESHFGGIDYLFKLNGNN